MKKMVRAQKEGESVMFRNQEVIDCKQAMKAIKGAEYDFRCPPMVHNLNKFKI